MFTRRQKLTPYLFISPFFIGYAIFFIYPILESFRLSFYRQAGIGVEPRFVGLANYERLLTRDDTFLRALGNTTQYALGSVFLIVPLALLLALLLMRKRLFGREFFRLFFFTPNITSGVVVGIIFGLVFNTDYGLINNLLLIPLGIPPVDWLRDATFIMPAIIILGIWRFTGINALYFMVGLQNIPPVLYEAAYVDGANRRQAFWHITLPMLRPVLTFILTFAIIGSYNLFTEPVILLGNTGGTENAGLTITMFLYNTAFRSIKLGYASAVGYILATIIIVLTIIQLYLTRTGQID